MNIILIELEDISWLINSRSISMRDMAE